MTIFTPRLALTQIRSLCDLGPQSPSWSPNAELLSRIETLARAALECPSVPSPIETTVINYALAYLDLAHIGNTDRVFSIAELVEAERLLGPLRPVKPLNPAIEALIAQAAREQMVSAAEADEWRALARRVAK